MRQLTEISLGIDELEAVRLKDLAGLEQEECARLMGVSQSTLQRTLTAARAKIAEALVMGRAIRIAGGNITETAPLPCDTAMPRRMRRHGPPWATSTDTSNGGQRGRGGRQIEPSDQQSDPR
jgi:predicted DNA-binding protein (UPF0251 family)